MVRRINVELLVGTYEVTQMIKLSDGRVSQLRKEDPTFPEPVHGVRATPLWLAPEIEHWLATRQKKKAGRPSNLQRDVIDYVMREMGCGGEVADDGEGAVEQARP